MMTNPRTVIREGSSFSSTVLREQDEWGLKTLDLVNLPRRFWGDEKPPFPPIDVGIDSRRTRPVPTPAEILQALPSGDTWSSQSKRSVGRLAAYFLIAEDPQRRLDARPVSTLSHQVSLVRHIFDNPNLSRVLIADEVGLGKTVEAGLIVKELLEFNSGIRVLYLAPARLVSNVRREFDRLGISFRQWTAGESDANLNDPRVIASIHRAVFASNFDRLINSGPWHVLIVDECHHLSDWAPGGGDATEKFKLVRDLIQRQPDGARVLFLSGTPHQGHVSRFENLLNLLRRSEEPQKSLSGRVIYRTKDDIRDWQGNPLFPPRRVNDPLIVDLGPEYKKWIEDIHEFYKPSRGKKYGDSRQRAAGWRCAQAMQWAASSPQAGVGYLTRQALRASWTLDDDPLLSALKALRPYRGGAEDEPVDILYQRMLKEVRQQQQDATIDDIEEDNSDLSKEDTDGLRELLLEGLAILQKSGDQKWKIIKNRLLDPFEDEKIVLFAQPIETVTALARFLEITYGQRPALIIGGQTDAERNEQIKKFIHPGGTRFLVSSRAGGEGINLQVSRRLIHIDVPWNPMDMEQRVGRVHRFGSRRTIIVDTVVVKDSREADAYRIARERLRLIASTLVESERFESVFARVMALIPPEELQDLLMNEPLSPFTVQDQEQIAKIVQDGYSRWSEFHRRYGEQQKQIKLQNPGLATWSDLAQFMLDFGQAEHAPGFKSQRFHIAEGQVQDLEQPVFVLRARGTHYVCDDPSEYPMFGPQDEPVQQLGLNLPVVSDALRQLIGHSQPTGAAHLRWPKEMPLPAQLTKGDALSVLAFARQSVRPDPQGGWIEHGLGVYCYAGTTSTLEEVDNAAKADLLRGIMRSTIRPRPDQLEESGRVLVAEETRLASLLRQPSQTELDIGIRHAVRPLLAAIIVV